MELGQIVTSKAGRDEGRMYVVVGQLDDRTVLVADGKHRKLTKPKRKNVVHLVKHNVVERDIQTAISERTVTDEQVRKVIDENSAQAHIGREEDSTVNGEG